MNNIPTAPTPQSSTQPSQPPPISSSLKQSKLSSLYQIVLDKRQAAKNNRRHINWPTLEKLFFACKQRLRPSKESSSSSSLIILRDHTQKTKPVIWAAAILCMLFSLIVIFFGIATLIVYSSVQPRKPSFDTPSAALSGIYFTAPTYLNSDVNLLANFSNPNRKLSVRYESMLFKLYFSGSLIAAEAVEPFSLRPGTARVVSVVMGSRMLGLAPSLVVELQKQAQRNRVSFDVSGRFRVRVKLGPIHYSYWIHELCELDVTNPPVSALVAHSCSTHE